MDSILFRSLAKDPAQRFQTMAAFRETLLDPERYGAAAPPPSRSSPELAVRVREAGPMARTVGPVRRARRPEGGLLEDPGLGQSTFRDSAGEVWTRDDSNGSKPKTHRLRTTLVLGVLASAVTASVRYRHQTTRFLDGAAAAVNGPAESRVPFNPASEDASVDAVADAAVDRPDATRGPILVLESADRPRGACPGARARTPAEGAGERAPDSGGA